MTKNALLVTMRGFILLLFLTAVESIHYEQTKNDQREAVFMAHENTQLGIPLDAEGVIQESILVPDDWICKLKCLRSEWCRSMNMKTHPTKNGMQPCELISSDKYNFSEYLLPNEDYNHYSIDNPCENGPCGRLGKCVALYRERDFICLCKSGRYGKQCKKIAKTCDEYSKYGVENPTADLNGSQSGVYTIDLADGNGTFQVYCDQTTSGGGWTIFQRRQDGSVEFYRKWQDYKTGFGNLNGEFWLGLDKIYRLTSQGKQMRLRIELEDFQNNTRFAEYDSFAISSEEDKYRLSVSAYSGTAGDGFARKQNGYRFSTRDQDNDVKPDGNCAVMFTGAWWYANCHHSNLNGLYLGGHNSRFGDGVVWLQWRGDYYSLKRAEMKIRPVQQ